DVITHGGDEIAGLHGGGDVSGRIVIPVHGVRRADVARLGLRNTAIQIVKGVGDSVPVGVDDADAVTVGVVPEARRAGSDRLPTTGARIHVHQRAVLDVHRRQLRRLVAVPGEPEHHGAA